MTHTVARQRRAITVRVDDALWSAIRFAAEHAELSVGEWVRRQLAAAIWLAGAAAEPEAVFGGMRAALAVDLDLIAADVRAVRDTLDDLLGISAANWEPNGAGRDLTGVAPMPVDQREADDAEDVLCALRQRYHDELAAYREVVGRAGSEAI